MEKVVRLKKQKFDVIGMTCASCQAHVEKDVSKVEGVQNVNVNLLANNMVVEYDENVVNEQVIIDAVRKGGYDASLPSLKSEVKEDKASSLADKEIQELRKRVVISFIFLIPLLYIAMGPMIGIPIPNFIYGSNETEIMKNSITFGLLQFLLTLPVMIVNKNYYITGFKRLFKRSPNMDSLIAIGTSAAVAYSIFALFMIGHGLGNMDMDLVMRYHMSLYFEAGATVLALVTFGKYLETKAKRKTSSAIEKLMDLAPKTALKVVGDDVVETLIEEIQVGDILLVKPGMSVPLDGVIIEGSSSIDQAAITGESVPVEKTVGDKVIGATINKFGSFKFRVEQVKEDTVLAKIVALVEEASSSKAPISKLVDKISGVFVPIVIAISLISFIVWVIAGQSFEFALANAIAVLVISCPCALGLATPVAIMVATGKGAENGILIKSAESLEIAHQVKTVVLDKTGTITEGNMKVSDIIPLNDFNKERLMQIAMSLEQYSEHPLAKAIMEKGKELNIDTIKMDRFTSLTGFGIKAELDGVTYFGGNEKLLEENKINPSEYQEVITKLSKVGKTPLYFASSEKIIGIIAVKDMIKVNSKKAIDKFKEMGIEVIMLTGDNKITAEAIKNELGLDKAIAEVLPDDKERIIKEIQESGHKVAMIGDGINDAPALVRADVGIAIGAGTDIAIESADIILVRNDLLDAVSAIKLSHKTINNIKMNLFWAFIYNVIGIPIAAGVFYPMFGLTLNPMFGALAMSLSSVSVVLNALRLRFFKAQH